MVANEMLTQDEMDINSAELDESSENIVDFIGVCPEGEIITNRRASDRPPFAYIVVGYHGDSGALGVFHWTSRTDKAYLKRVLINQLRNARKHSVNLPAKNLHIIEATQVKEVPENALYIPKGQRHFFPAATLQETIAALAAALENPEITEEKREAMEERLVRLTDKLTRKTTEGLSGEVVDITDLTVVAAEGPGEEGPEVFRTKKVAVSVAKERGLSVENVVKDDEGNWVIEAR